MPLAPLLVLHDLGDEEAGGPWRRAFAAAGWEGHVLAPDLPGHGSAPVPEGGDYVALDAAFAALRALRVLEGPVIEGPVVEGAPVVVGVGAIGWAAQVLALGGRASALVLVDGLGGPWADRWTSVAAQRRHLRAIADDPAAVAPPPSSGLDPRLRHGVGCQTGRGLAERMAAAMPVPVLVLDSPASLLSADERDDLTSRFAGGSTVIPLAHRGPTEVAARVTPWAEVVEGRRAKGAGGGPAGHVEATG